MVIEGEGTAMQVDGFELKWQEDCKTFLSHGDIPDYPEQTISCNIDTHDWFTLTELPARVAFGSLIIQILDPVHNWRINYMTQRQIKRAKRRLRRKKARPNKTKQKKRFRNYIPTKSVHDFKGYISGYDMAKGEDRSATITVKIVE